MTDRLETVFPELASELRISSSSKQKQAAIKACKIAIAKENLAEDELTSVLASLFKNDVVDIALVEKIQKLSADWDEQYLINNEDSPEVALQFFSKARIASAISFALIGDGQFSDSIYEAALAIDDPSEIKISVRKILDSSE